MKEKGQALVEFILILPVLIFIVLSLIDIGNIFLNKYELNNELETVTSMYQNNNSQEMMAYIAKEEVTLDTDEEANMITFTLKKKVEINTPGLSNVLGKNYEISSTKTIYKEDLYE